MELERNSEENVGFFSDCSHLDQNYCRLWNTDWQLQQRMMKLKWVNGWIPLAVRVTAATAGSTGRILCLMFRFQATVSISD